MASQPTGSEPVIRRGQPRDLEALVEFNQAMAEETEGLSLPGERLRAGIEAVLADAMRGFYLVAEGGPGIAAALMVTTEWSDWRNGFFWWIQSVYVRPDCRRQGLYAALYRRVQAMADDHDDVCGFRLYVERENETAQRTYRSLGMNETAYRLYESER